MTIDPLNEIRNILDAFEEKIARTQTIWEERRELTLPLSLAQFKVLFR